jgi:hypothetical protein
MPYCVAMKLPNGGTALVRVAGKRPLNCRWCERLSTKLCDFDISPPNQVTHRRTCDAPMCDIHALPVGINKDYCLDHKEK